MKKIKTAIIGYGMATKFFHLPPLFNHDVFEVTHILTRNKDKHQEILEKAPNVTIISSFDAVLSNEDIKLVIIATSNDVHATYTRQAILAKKHVVCEKPFVESFEEAKALYELAEKNNVILNVFHNREYDGDILTMKRLLDTEDFGDIQTAEFRFDRLNPNISENWRDKDSHMAGVFYDLAPHLIFDVLVLFGKPSYVSLDLMIDRTKALVDDHFEMTLTYDNGPYIKLGAGVLTRHDVPRFLIEGTKKTYAKHGFDQPDCNYEIKGDSYQSSGLKSILIDNEKHHKDIPLLLGQHYLFYDHLADQIEKNKIYQKDLALLVVKIMALALTSNKEKRKVLIP